MAWNFSIGFGNNNTNQIDTTYWSRIVDSLTNSTKFKSDEDKLKKVLSNPALLKVIVYLSDVYSQVKFNDHSTDKVEEDFLYSISKRPNEWQTWTQLHWDVYFWRSLGNAYIYKQGDNIYCLRSVGIKFTDKQIKKLSQITFSKYGDNSRSKILNDTFVYENENGEKQTLQLKNLYVLNDLSGGVSGNWYKGNSRLDALYEVVNNSELALKSKGINLDFSGKFFVNGQYNGSVDQNPMSDDEQQSIENKLTGKGKNIFATKSKIDINQLVSNLSQLKLSEHHTDDLILIGSIFGVSRTVLDILSKGSTFENKEKSIGELVDYTLMPKAVDHSDLYEVIYDKESIKPSFKHLPFNAVFEAERVANTKVEIETLKIASELGLDPKIVTEKLKQIYGN